MVLSRREDPSGFPLPLALSFLLPSDPRHPFRHGLADRIVSDAKRRRDPQASVGRTYPEVQVPDPLPVDFHLDIVHAQTIYP